MPSSFRDAWTHGQEPAREQKKPPIIQDTLSRTYLHSNQHHSGRGQEDNSRFLRLQSFTHKLLWFRVCFFFPVSAEGNICSEIQPHYKALPITEVFSTPSQRSSSRSCIDIWCHMLFLSSCSISAL